MCVWLIIMYTKAVAIAKLPFLITVIHISSWFLCAMQAKYFMFGYLNHLSRQKAMKCWSNWQRKESGSNYFWPNFLVWSPPWLYASSVKNKTKSAIGTKLTNISDEKTGYNLEIISNRIFGFLLSFPISGIILLFVIILVIIV